MAGDRQGNSKCGAGPISAVRSDDRAVHGLDKTARDRKPEPGAGSHLVRLLYAVKFIKDVLEIGAGMPLPSSSTRRQTEFPLRQA